MTHTNESPGFPGRFTTLDLGDVFHNQLGSLVRIADANGASVNQMDFMSFGGRRNIDTQAANGTAPTLTPRGFTGHEMLDSQGALIHMSGRVYDAHLGRFLQPDPLIQAPDNAQSWNAYTYAFNNPLVYTDPTGMFNLRQVLGIAIAIVGTVFAPQFTSVWAKIGYAALIGAASGYVSTGTMQGAVWGAFSAAAFAGIGTYFDSGGAGWAQAAEGSSGVFGSGLSVAGYSAKVLAHGMTGGVMSKLQGGKFGNGFASAGVTQALSPAIDTIDLSNSGASAVRIAAAAIVGGTASELSGGKFANGAVTGAFS